MCYYSNVNDRKTLEEGNWEKNNEAKNEAKLACMGKTQLKKKAKNEANKMHAKRPSYQMTRMVAKRTQQIKRKMAQNEANKIACKAKNADGKRNFKRTQSPSKGVEPLALRLRVLRSHLPGRDLDHT